jgi:hypothetical protein
VGDDRESAAAGDRVLDCFGHVRISVRVARL